MVCAVQKFVWVNSMVDNKCMMSYCKATVGDFNEIINEIKCRCMMCFGEKTDTCDIYKKSARMGIDLQYKMCSKCKFFNGK